MYLSPQKCTLCAGKTLESVLHLVTKCRVVASILNRILSAANVVGPPPGSFVEFLVQRIVVCRARKKIWLVVVDAVFWSIWLERNSRIWQNIAVKSSGYCNTACLYHVFGYKIV